jgi:hypothetical protein
MMHDIVSVDLGAQPGRKVRAAPKRLCNARTQTGRLCQRAALANGRCGLHGGPIHFPSPHALARVVANLAAASIENPTLYAKGPRAMLKALRRDVLAILGRRQLRAWGAAEEHSARAPLSSPDVVEGRAVAHPADG